jgi:hypothetical protein
MLARQALPRVTSPALFVLIILEIGSHCVPKLAWSSVLLFALLHVDGMTGAHHLPSYWLRWGRDLMNFLPRQVLNSNPADLRLPSS